MQPGCQLGTTLKQSSLHILCLRNTVTLSNIYCPLGPYVPAAMMCLSAVQAPCLTKVHHMTTSILSRQHLYIQTTLHVTFTLCIMSHGHYAGIPQMLCGH